MAGRGRRFTFHGAYKSASDAERKARKLKARGQSAFVKRKRFRRLGVRSLVMVPK